MAQTIRLRRGLESALPTTGLSIGEPLYTTDKYNVYVADSATTHKPLTPNVNDLSTLASIDVSNDLLMFHDVSEASNQREKKATVQALKTALNIPTASSDELVAVVSGGTAGYVWGTDGTDGILRVVTGELSYEKDAGNAFVTFGIADDGVDNQHIAPGAVDTTELATDAVTTIKITNLNVTTGKLADDAVTTAKLDDAALNLGAVFSGTGVDTSLTIAALGITNGMLAATALDVNATTFSGNGTTTELDVAVIDGGSF